MKKVSHNFWAAKEMCAPAIKASVHRLLKPSLLLFFTLSVLAVGSFADEQDSRRVDISLSIFPRIIAVDNHFRDKLSDDKEAQLLFVYDEDEEYAQQLAERMKKGNANIGGMKVSVSVVSAAAVIPRGDLPTALFVAEKLTDAQLRKIMVFAKETHRLVFSPYVGDVERGATVGISVTNRVKPYFNLSSLRQSKIAINALLMKMSKRHE